MLDAFGPIGGHNFSWAWATGRAAGLAPPADRRTLVERVGEPIVERPREVRLVGWPAAVQRLVRLHPLRRSPRLRPRHAACRSAICRCRSTTTRIAGTRTFPYQWRVLAFWMVHAGDRSIAPIDPHVIDVAIKTLALAASGALLYMFSTTLVSALGAVLAVGDLSVRDRRRVRLRRLRDLLHERLPRDPVVVRRRRRAAQAHVVGSPRSPHSRARGPRKPRC